MTLEYFRIRNRCKQQFPSQNLVMFKVVSIYFWVRTCWVMKLGYSTFCLGLRRCQDVDVMNWEQVKQWRWTAEVMVPYLKLYLKPCPFKRVDQTRKRIFLATVYDSKDHKIFLIAKLSNHKSMNIHWISWLHASSRLHLAQASLWQQITWWIRC